MQSPSPVYTKLFKQNEIYFLRLPVPDWIEGRAVRRRALEFSLRTKDIDVALQRRNFSAQAIALFFSHMKAQKPSWPAFREAWAYFIRCLIKEC